MSNKLKRLHLLDEYKKVIESLPFKTLDGENLVAENVYICPLCLESFNIEESLEKLTMEDVPPKSLGGKPVLITCKKCNNTCGHKLDVYLLNEYRYLQESTSFGGNGKATKLSINGVQVNARIKQREDKTFYVDVGNNNNPSTLKSFLENVEVAGDNWEIHGTVKLIDFKRNIESAKIAILKSAYLLAFQKLGYRYILNANLNIVRDMIMYPDRDYKTVFIVGNNQTLNPNLKDDVYLAEIKGVKAILVVFSLRVDVSNSLSRYAVALPSHGNKEDTLYKKVLSLEMCNKERLHVKIKGLAKIVINSK